MASVNVTGLLVVDCRGPAAVKHAKLLVRDGLWRVWQEIAPDLLAEGEVDWETAADCALDKFAATVGGMTWRQASAALAAFKVLTFEEQEAAAEMVFKGRV